MGQPTAVKVFMMWQKLIQGLCAKNDPDVNPMVPFCGINGFTEGTEHHISQICKICCFSSFSS